MTIPRPWQQVSNCSAGDISKIAATPFGSADIPLSAVDFHISSIVEELLQNQKIRAAAQVLAASGRQRSASDLLKRAMWLFRSGKSSKTIDPPSTSDKDQEMQILQPFWEASQAAADVWSANYINRRFL